jgi:hypothetical protein
MHDDVTLQGKHTFKYYGAENPQAKELINALDRLHFEVESMRKQYQGTEKWREVNQYYVSLFDYLMEELERYTVREETIYNLTTLVGRGSLTGVLAGDGTSSGTVNFTALGTSTTAPAEGQTQLGAEVYRKGLSVGQSLNNQAILRTFFNPLEVTGTFEEYGNFIDGNITANSGVMFNRFIGQQVKSSIEALIVINQITLTNL